MTFPTFKNLIVICFLVLFLPFTVVQCTSSDEDSSVIEDELESMDDGAGDTMADDIDDLDDITNDELTDVVDEGDDELAELSDDEDDSFEDEGDDFAESGGDDFDDEGGDSDFDDESEFAESDDSEFDEFDEVDGKEGDKEFAQNEEALAEEINKPPQDYPVAQDAKPQFPEEVISQDNPVPPPGDIGQPLPPPGGPLIVSETQGVTDLPDPIEPTLPQDDLGMADPIVPLPDSEYGEDRTWVPVVKVKTDPFYKSQRLLNAVYIARPDETLSSISEKIYGDDRSKELNEDNPHLAKGIDPGDKIYYNSPNRSDDKSTLKIYYDDVGLAPQFYKTKNNDNMRRLGTKLIGFNEGWKEIWAINPQVDSKTILPSGMELKYWTGNETKASVDMAESSSADEPAPTDPTDQPEEFASAEVDESFDDSELPPEPPLPEAQIAAPDPTFEADPVPDIEPFPEEGVEETPGPAVVAAPANSNNSLLSVGAIALLIMAGAGLVAIQIKRRRDNTGINPASLEYTQV